MRLHNLYSGTWSHINLDKPDELPEQYKEEYFYDDSNYFSDPFDRCYDSPTPFGLKRSASEEDIKKKYRELILKHHPDKGGDEEKFKSIQREWEEYNNEY